MSRNIARAATAPPFDAKSFLASVGAGRSTATYQPMAAVFFGSPYVPASVPELPAMLLTYDFSDLAESSAVRGLAGEIPIGGRLPISIPGLFQAGHGLTRRP